MILKTDGFITIKKNITLYGRDVSPFYFREHWFTIRRLGSQWFNLNSLLEYPELGIFFSFK